MTKLPESCGTAEPERPVSSQLGRIESMLNELLAILKGNGVVAGMAQKQDNLFLLQAEKFTDLAENDGKLLSAIDELGGQLHGRMDVCNQRLGEIAEEYIQKWFEKVTGQLNTFDGKVMALGNALGDATDAKCDRITVEAAIKHHLIQAEKFLEARAASPSQEEEGQAVSQSIDESLSGVKSGRRINERTGSACYYSSSGRVLWLCQCGSQKQVHHNQQREKLLVLVCGRERIFRARC